MSTAIDLDLLIVGSGAAGLSAAARGAAPGVGMRIGVLSKGALSDSATQWAQGGVAAVMHHSEAEIPPTGDSPDLHLSDTLQAGGGLCDRSAVEILVSEGPLRVRELAGLGAEFDRTEEGKWRLAREGGHSVARVVHAGGAATGAEVERTLVEVARARASRIWEGCFAADLIVEQGRCRGVIALGADGNVIEIRAAQTLLATGGSGQLYGVTTNPEQCTGDGLAMAIRAGVPIADVEFVQFHPTALHGAVAGPRPLLSEALRGEGALLRDQQGMRFVDEMQPRDVVAAAVAAQIQESGVDFVWLDVSGVSEFEKRFPNLAESVARQGVSPGTDWIPVAPAAHYFCGGVVTDLDGATALPGLWAAGEVACTGVHGANRLASNSLLEGMVFGARVVEGVLAGRDGPLPTGAMLPVLRPGATQPGGVGAVRLQPRSLPRRSVAAPRPPAATEAGPRDRRIAMLQTAMTAGAGVVRSRESLDTARSAVDATAADLQETGGYPGEFDNLVLVASAVIAAAIEREESRGGHRRSDFPQTSQAFSHRFVQ